MLRVGWGVGTEEGGLLLRLGLVYIPNLSLLLSLESLEMFVWWWVVVVGCKLILVFSLSLSQAEQQKVTCNKYLVVSIRLQVQGTRRGRI